MAPKSYGGGETVMVVQINTVGYLCTFECKSSILGIITIIFILTRQKPLEGCLGDAQTSANLPLNLYKQNLHRAPSESHYYI